jgi:hypothetical protein
MGWNDQADNNDDFITLICEDLAATDKECAHIYTCTVPAEHLLSEHSKSTPNGCLANVDTCVTDCVVNYGNTPADNQATLLGDNIDPSLTHAQI